MKCCDYGRIFVPQDYGLDYCKSPQPIVLDDRIRVYFSYCIKDGIKLKSCVGFVDFDKGFKKVLRVSDSVLDNGLLGTFDEHGVFPFSPFVGPDKKIYAVTTGWNRKQSVSTETAIGLVCSSDGGETFERVGTGPIMTANLKEPFLVADGYVVKREKQDYVMFYIYGTDWETYKDSAEPERTYRIAMAYSKNLLDWNRDSVCIIPARIEGEAQALPSVIKISNRWHMFFCYRYTVGFRNDPEKGYRIGYAYSDDLIEWKRVDDAIRIPTSDWDSDMQCYPCVFKMDDEVYLLYNGNKFGKEGFGLIKLEDIK